MSDHLIKKLKRDVIIASHRAGEGHIASAFSILDILWVLYDRIILANESHDINLQKNRFILSKGHASLALYVILAQKNLIPRSELDDFCKFNSNLGGHPDSNKIKFVEASTGSLGHGFPIALGMALGAKIKKIDRHFFCLIGDGECNEGTIWESALLGSHHNLNNLTCIIDYNHSTDRALRMGDLSEKFQSFGWDTLKINGHDHESIFNALSCRQQNKPLAIIASTIKGKGVTEMENNPAWHHKAPTTDEVKNFLAELI